MKRTGYGNTVLILFQFSLPLILSGVLQQLYNWADAFIVGRVLGEEPLAAVGMTSSVVSCVILLITGFTLGISVLAAQHYGRGNSKAVRGLLRSFLVILFAAVLMISALLFCFSEVLLKWMDTPENIFAYTRDYLRIILLGVPFLGIYNLYAGILRAVGDSKASFFAVAVSSVINILLDTWFVAGLRLGIKSAAWATVAAQIGMTGFLVLYTAKRHPALGLSAREPLFGGNTVGQGLRYALPLTIQSGVSAMGHVVLQSFMNRFGSHTVAAVTTAYRVDSVMMLPIINLGAAISTMVAQSRGAGKPEKTGQFAVAGTGMSLLTGLLLTAAMYCFGGSIIGIFGIEEEALEIGTRFFRTICVYYLFCGLQSALQGILEGWGRVVISGVIGIGGLAVRIALSYWLAPVWGNMTIAHAEGLHWLFMSLCCLAAVTAMKRPGSRLSRRIGVGDDP